MKTSISFSGTNTIDLFPTKFQIDNQHSFLEQYVWCMLLYPLKHKLFNLVI